jgi:hypothetical protein
MYKNKMVEYHKQGVNSFEDVLPYLGGTEYYQQVDMELHETEPYINKDKIRNFLDTLHYPLYFLDFETIAPVIPLYDGTKPRMKQVFQYSLHILDSENAELRHKEYLGNPNIDVREEIAKSLCEIIPHDACIVAYHSSFERERL